MRQLKPWPTPLLKQERPEMVNFERKKSLVVKEKLLVFNGNPLENGSYFVHAP